MPYMLRWRGQDTGLVELPVEWLMDDWPHFETHRMTPKQVWDIWKPEWDGIYTTYYSNHNPDVPKLSTTIVYLGPAEYWDGSQYVTNHPQSIHNPDDAKCTVLVLGSNGLSRTYELGKNYSLLVYPPIGVYITLSILP